MCGHDEPATVESLKCELGQGTGRSACADPKARKAVSKTFAKVGARVDKLATASEKKRAKLQKAIGRALAAIERKLAKSKKTDDACKAPLEELVDEIQALLAEM